MPLIKLQMSEKCEIELKESLCKELSRVCASEIGKPESYVMSLVEDDAVVCFGGVVDKAAFVEVKSIGGLSADVNTRLSYAICACIEEKTGICGSKIYINFTNVDPSSWGFNGSTF